MENNEDVETRGKSWKMIVIFIEAAGAQEQRMNSRWTVVIFVNMCK